MSRYQVGIFSVLKLNHGVLTPPSFYSVARRFNLNENYFETGKGRLNKNRTFRITVVKKCEDLMIVLIMTISEILKIIVWIQIR
jgi:hypothetical protein